MTPMQEVYIDQIRNERFQILRENEAAFARFVAVVDELCGVVKKPTTRITIRKIEPR